MRIKTTATIALGLQLCFLTTTALGGEWTGRTTIRQLTIRDDRTVIVRQHGGSWINPDLCTRDGSILLSPPEVQGGAAGYKEIYATLLSALLTGRQINVFIDGCVSFGSHTFPAISQVAIY